jgi:hypothetical protein
MGNPRPIAGAETRTCTSSPRSGAGSTTGFTETTGVGALMATSAIAVSDSLIARLLGGREQVAAVE